MLSLLMLLLAIMTAVSATSGSKQSAQTTVSSYGKPYVNLLGNIQGRSGRFCRCTHVEEKISSVEAGPTSAGLVACSPLKIFKFIVSEMLLLAFSSGHFQ